VLAALQADAARDPSKRTELNALQFAVEQSFRAMNYALHDTQPHWNGHRLSQFLCQFDAIFTLNQDLFFELTYDPVFRDHQPYENFQFPGISTPEDWTHRRGFVEAKWELNEQVVMPSKQPIFKLHGSSNWADESGAGLMVMGSGKREAIAGRRLLRWYSQQFREWLARSDTRLMVIGYSFRDEHINEAIAAATTASLRLFLVDPGGAEVLQNASKHQTQLQNLLLAGESRRPLVSTIKSDDLEYGKLERFFL
jgi:hypothetical protein